MKTSAFVVLGALLYFFFVGPVITGLLEWHLPQLDYGVPRLLGTVACGATLGFLNWRSQRQHES